MADAEGGAPRVQDAVETETEAEASVEAETEVEIKPARKRRTQRPFPATSFMEALFLAEAIQEHGAGQRTRRLTLFEALDRSPDSGPTRKLITSSAQYGITTGGYSAEFLELTPKGAVASSPTSAARAQRSARVELAVLDVTPFAAVYEKYKGSRLPTVEVLRDAAREAGVAEDFVAECVETFLVNARELGLVRTIGGSEHLVTTDAALESLDDEAEEPRSARVSSSPGLNASTASAIATPRARPAPAPAASQVTGDLSTVCFVISPIGSPDSPERKHADLVSRVGSC